MNQPCKVCGCFDCSHQRWGWKTTPENHEAHEELRSRIKQLEVDIARVIAERDRLREEVERLKKTIASRDNECNSEHYEALNGLMAELANLREQLRAFQTQPMRGGNPR